LADRPPLWPVFVAYVGAFGAIVVLSVLAITGWLSATADLQVIDPALKKTLSSSGQGGLVNVDTAVVAGIRIRARF